MIETEHRESKKGMGCSHTKSQTIIGEDVSNGHTVLPAILLGGSFESTRRYSTRQQCHSLDVSRFKIPLSEREILTVIKSWKKVTKDLTFSGTNMFLRMFQTRHDVRETFEQFRTMDDNDDVSLQESHTLQTHGMVVMSAIDEIISNLDDEEYVVNLILEQGQSHVKFGDLSSRMFWAIQKPFLFAVEDTLGAKYTPKLASLYEKTIHYILSTLIEGFDVGVRHAFGPYGKL